MCCRYWARGYDNLLQSKKAQLFISKVGCTSSGKICTSCVFSLDVKVSCSNNRVCLSKNSFFFCMQHLDDVQSRNVMHYMQAIHQRVDLSDRLKKLKCPTLIIVGEQSPFHHEAMHISTQMHRRYNALIEVQACGSLVTEEQPHSMFVPMDLFLSGYSFYQRPVYYLSSTPTFTESTLCCPRASVS
jgi:hypothetical protein